MFFHVYIIYVCTLTLPITGMSTDPHVSAPQCTIPEAKSAVTIPRTGTQTQTETKRQTKRKNVLLIDVRANTTTLYNKSHVVWNNYSGHFLKLIYIEDSRLCLLLKEVLQRYPYRQKLYYFFVTNTLTTHLYQGWSYRCERWRSAEGGRRSWWWKERGTE